MREELEKRILIYLASRDIDIETLRNELYLILNDYEIEERKTEVSLLNEDEVKVYCNKFLISKKIQGCTDRTIKKYKASLRMFFDSVQKSPLTITPDDIRLFLISKEMRDKTSKVYIKNLQRDISSFYTWLTKEEYISKNPMNKVESIKAPKVKKEAYSDMEIEKIRNHSITRKEKAIVELLLSTGCRVTELTLIKKTDIKSDGSIIVHGKGQKDRTVYLNAKSKYAIQQYLDKEGEKYHDTYLFGRRKRKGSKDIPVDVGVIEEIVRNIGQRAGVQKCHPHRFRRTCATLAMRKGMPIEYVSKMLGHESVETTQVYLDMKESDLKNMHEKFVV